MSSNNSTNLSSEKLLDTLLPGFGLLSRLILFYLQIDLSAYSLWIFIIAISWTFITFVLPKLFQQLQNGAMHYAPSVTVMYQDPLYDVLIAFIAGHAELNQTTHSIAGTKASYNSPFRRLEVEEDEKQEETAQSGKDIRPDFSPDDQEFWRSLRDWNTRNPILLTPKKDDTCFFWHRGRMFALRRKSFANDKSDSFYAFMENITIYTAPWNRHLLRALLEEIQREGLQNKSNEINVFRGMRQPGGGQKWKPMKSNVYRPLASVALDSEQKKAVEDAKRFLHPTTRQWYEAQYMPYRRGYLFYGPPGTGKTSLCLAMATFFWLDIYILSLSSLDEDKLALLLQELPERCILLIEDVDVAGLRNRPIDVYATGVEMSEEQLLSDHDNESPSSQGSISLSAFLNCIDGVGAPSGRVLIMTTNHRDKLDHALTRKARVDVEVKFEFASSPVVQELFNTFYTPKDPLVNGDRNQSAKNSPDNTLIHSLSTEFAGHIPSGRVTPATIRDYLIRHREDPESAVAEASEWIKLELAHD
ncbi:uncharacterized protein N7484_008171 [Penicillium longicatenatum]|uniref:uncharacterized protein n=1 Tax=Penicillium longicatenatum TaxID=1561947 RepID=UPI0025493A5F|nr:uncharacterized protein N7484_008171 [Penicillium longicatenatum]KAJ5640309.1 hypothetical protein N7484_008171 [Penicillium longicatenatum]